MKAKEKIIAAIEKLLKTKELDRISVSEIVAEAQVCRKTFYRNFSDKYDLMNYYFENFFQDNFAQIIYGEDYDHAMLKSLEIYEQKADILNNAYSSSDINGLRNYDIQSTRRIFEKFLLDKGADISTREMQFAIEIASRGGTDMIIEWMRNGMKEDKETLQRLLKRTMPNDMLIYLEDQ